MGYVIYTRYKKSLENTNVLSLLMLRGCGHIVSAKYTFQRLLHVVDNIVFDICVFDYHKSFVLLLFDFL